MEEHGDIHASQHTISRRCSTIFLLSAVSKIETAGNYLGVLLIMCLMVAGTMDVAGRYLFDRPLRGFVDIAELMMVGIAFLCLAHTQRIGGHISIDFFIDRLFKGRAHALASFLVSILSLFIFAVIGVYGLKAALEARAFGDISPSVYLPTWPARLIIPIGSFLLCVRLFIQAIQHFARALSRIKEEDSV